MKPFKSKQVIKADWNDNVYIPTNNGVTKSVAQLWWENGGNFNPELYDKLIEKQKLDEQERIRIDLENKEREKLHGHHFMRLHIVSENKPHQ